MTTFTFEAITAAQALAITAADTLVVQTGAANEVTVIYNPAIGLATDTVTITMGARSVTFAPAVAVAAQSGQVQMADGARLYIGYTAGDRVVGAGLGDAAFGGLGADTLDGDAGRDVLQGNQGDDSLVGGTGDDTVYGGQDNDIIALGSGANIGQGNKGHDSITGGASAETILGGQDNDSITGAGGADFLNGNLGDDTVVGAANADQILGEDGADSLAGAAGGDTLEGGLGDDTLSGGAAKDILSGGAGADRFVFEAGSSGSTAGAFDLISDWDASDRLDFAAAGGSYAESTAANLATAATFANAQIAAGVDVVAVQVGADVMVFVDTGADDGVYEDAVVLAGRTVGDIDSANLIDNGGPTVINGTAAAENVTGTARDDIISAMAGADSVVGLAGNDTIDGAAGADIIDGGDGGDSVTAGDGADSIAGGAGADTLDGGIGADIFNGGLGGDRFVLLGGEADVVQVSAGDSAVTAAAVSSAGADEITGWVSADHVIHVMGFASGTVANYVEGAAPVADYAAAYAAANAALNGGGVIYYAAQVTGTGVVIFHDVDSDGTFENGETAVVLVGSTLADIGFGDIVGA